MWFSSPQLVLGTSHIGSVLPDALVSRADRKTINGYLDDVHQLGIRVLDLAASYQAGGTERAVGHWLKASRSREQVKLISKGGHPIPIIQENRLTPRDITADLDASLQRLGTEYIDLYFLHRDHPDADLEALLRCLSGQQRLGKIRAFGVSNWTHERLRALQTMANLHGFSPPVANSPQFSLRSWRSPPWKGCVSLSGQQNQTARDYHRQTQTPVFAYSPFGVGKAYDTPDNTRLQKRIDSLATRLGISTQELMLAYVQSHGFPVSPITASKNLGHLKTNQAVVLAGTRLSNEHLAFLHADGESAAAGTHA